LKQQKKAGISAHVYIYLQLPDDDLIERANQTRFDPQTGKTYHLNFNPPPTDIANRVVQRTEDTKEKYTVRLSHFHEQMNAVLGRLGEETCGVKINGNQDKNEVFKAIEQQLG